MTWSRLGLIAGGGELPVHVAEAAGRDGRLGCVVALKGFAQPERYASPVNCRSWTVGGSPEGACGGRL